MEPKWLDWAKRLQAISQIGLTFCNNPFDLERYEAIRQISAEIFATSSDETIEKIVGLFSQNTGYATPKIDLRGAVFQDDTILLVKEALDGRWTLPGGWADVCEAPSEGVVREIFEESGYEARAVRLLAVFDRSKHPHVPPFPYHIYKMFFLCELTGGAPKKSIETSDVGFFKLDNLPELSISRVLSSQIELLFELKDHPERPTVFD